MIQNKPELYDVADDEPTSRRLQPPPIEYGREYADTLIDIAPPGVAPVNTRRVLSLAAMSAAAMYTACFAAAKAGPWAMLAMGAWMAVVFTGIEIAREVR